MSVIGGVTIQAAALGASQGAAFSTAADKHGALESAAPWFAASLHER